MGGKRTGAGKFIYFCTVSLSIFNLTILSLSGCAIFEKGKIALTGDEAHRYILHSQKLLAQGDYEGALKDNQKVLSLSGNKPPGDEALFNMGLIYAHSGNPRKDYRKSLSSFKKLVEGYPESPWVEQAKIWTEMLQENEKLNQMIEKLYETLGEPKPADIKIEAHAETQEFLLRARKLLAQGDYEGALKNNQKVLSLSGSKSPGDEALFNMGLIYAHPGNPKKDYGKSLIFFKKLMKDYPKSPWIERTKIWIGMLQENEKLSRSVEELNQVIEKSQQVDIEIEEKKREKGK